MCGQFATGGRTARGEFCWGVVQLAGHPAVTREGAGSSPAAPATLCTSGQAKDLQFHRLPPEPEEQVGPYGWGPASFCYVV